jgi:hypothetical protein
MQKGVSRSTPVLFASVAKAIGRSAVVGGCGDEETHEFVWEWCLDRMLSIKSA